MENYFFFFREQLEVVLEISKEVQSDLEVNVIDVAVAEEHRLVVRRHRLILHLTVVGLITID